MTVLLRRCPRWLYPIILSAGITVPIVVAAEGSKGTSPAGLPFHTGERLTYHISWLRMQAGSAIMAVEDSAPINEHRTILLQTVAQSSPVVTKFYPVLNRVQSIVDVETFLPARMVFNRREGKRRNDFEYTFRHQAGTVTAVKDGKTEELSIPSDAQDAISCLYYVRKMLAMIPGSALGLNIHHDKKNYKLDVRVEGLETLEGPWGTAQTARVLVVMPFQGIFLNEGNIRVWFTTDDRHIPVRMKAKVVIGSIVADLATGVDIPEGSK